MESREPKSVPQLSLQWHHHHKALVSLLDVLWEKQELVDVTLAAEGQYLQVHRIVLCACSSYFKDVLTEKSNSDKHAIVFLKDVYYHDLKALVHYMYKGEVQINEDQLNSFLHTAKSLGIRGLMGSDRGKGKKKKRRRGSTSSLDTSDEYSCDENNLPVALPPPPPPLKHMTSLTKAVEIKVEDPSSVARYEPEMSLDLQPDLDSLRDSSISAHELDDEGLGLFHCAEEDPGPSKTSDDENNPSGHDYNGYWVEEPAGTGSRSDRVPCPQCHRDYSTHDLMKRHLRYECGVEPQFQCPICLKRTKHKHNLTSHMKIHLKPI